MADTDLYTMTDAMVHCMKQPGAIAVAFVELKTGRAIAGDGIHNLDIDALTPSLTDLLLGCGDQARRYPQADDLEDTPYEIPEMAITGKNRVDLLYPLSNEGSGLYLYLALDRNKGNIPLGRRCLVDIDSRLHL